MFLMCFIPICSMYGIFTNMCPKNHQNVGKYTIHGASGYGGLFFFCVECYCFVRFWFLSVFSWCVDHFRYKSVHTWFFFEMMICNVYSHLLGCMIAWPIGSMYGIYANIWGILMVNVTIYIAYMDPMGDGVKATVKSVMGFSPGWTPQRSAAQWIYHDLSPPITANHGWGIHEIWRASLGTTFDHLGILWWTNIAIENGHRNSGFSH